MIAREEIGSGEYLDPKGRLFLRSGMPEFSFTDELIEEMDDMEDGVLESAKKTPAWKSTLIDAGIYALLIGLVTLGIILSQSNH